MNRKRHSGLALLFYRCILVEVVFEMINSLHSEVLALKILKCSKIRCLNCSNLEKIEQLKVESSSSSSSTCGSKSSSKVQLQSSLLSSGVGGVEAKARRRRLFHCRRQC